MVGFLVTAVFAMLSLIIGFATYFVPARLGNKVDSFIAQTIRTCWVSGRHHILDQHRLPLATIAAAVHFATMPLFVHRVRGHRVATIFRVALMAVATAMLVLQLI